MDQTNDIRFGLIGLGHVACHQMSALESVKGVGLSAACDIDSARAALVGDTVPFFDNLEAFLTSGLFDAVLVSVPVRSHAQVSARVLDAGFHVVLEKPLTYDLAALDELIAAASANELMLLSALHAAYGREVEWFVEKCSQDAFSELGRLIGFSSRFYDPYCNLEGLTPGARSLEGSWFDSSINALSVIGRIMETEVLKLDYSALTIVEGMAPKEIQGMAEFSFSLADGVGHGSIDTNWTLGLNSKITRLFYEHGAEIVLQHSTETVYLKMPGEQMRVLASLFDGIDRLTAHYLGVYRDVALMLHSKVGNIDHARALHALAFAAYDPPNPIENISPEKVA